MKEIEILQKQIQERKQQKPQNRLSRLRQIRSLAKQEKGDLEGLLLLDTSGSMNALLRTKPGQRRIDALREEVGEFIGMVPTYHFNTIFAKVTEGIPEPSGTTNLAEAIYELAVVEQERKLIVVTDGRPNSEPLALRAATTTGFICDVVYVGDPPEPPFCAELANKTGGSVGSVELGNKQLTAKIRGLLEGK